MNKYVACVPDLVKMLLEALYVDDLPTEDQTVEEAVHLFLKSISQTPHIQQNLLLIYCEPMVFMAQLATSCCVRRIEQLYLHSQR